MRTPTLRVYRGNHGSHISIMAARSMKIFMAATGISRDYCSRTLNEEEIAVAMAEPGFVFFKPCGSRDLPWSRITNPRGGGRG